jgi:brefeldin A-inhibited guanine nucleotide-exchange protein
MRGLSLTSHSYLFRILNVLSKITLTPVHLTVAQTAEHQAANQAAQAAYDANASVSSPTLSPTPSQTSLQSPPSHTPSVEGHAAPKHPVHHQISSSSEYNLKVQSLKTLVMTLQSLIVWSQQGIVATIESTSFNDEAFPRTPTEETPGAVTPESTPGSRSVSQKDPTNRGQLTDDDPEQFEALKYRKTALQDAIQKFNFKPKRVYPLVASLIIGN